MDINPYKSTNPDALNAFNNYVLGRLPRKQILEAYPERINYFDCAKAAWREDKDSKTVLSIRRDYLKTFGFQ